MREAFTHITREIENLRTIITELRPAALDELGLGAAIEALLERHREHSGFAIEAEISLPQEPGRLDGELESTVYRLVQEALTNVAKHAGAMNVRVSVRSVEGQLQLEVQDDGAGFDAGAVSHGFGLAGMRERAGLAGGGLEIDTGGRGTLVTATLPVRKADAGDDPFRGAQATA
jgi:signal transduction histidine kinase